MESRIELLSEKKLVGMRLRMSFDNNKTRELWMGFMPRCNRIRNRVSSELFSVEIYDNSHFFNQFNSNAIFEKWAAVEVSRFDEVLEEMEILIIPRGQYAVFTYIGRASDAFKSYQYIFNEWIPNSGYILDNRPHFALMGEKYKNDDPSSEEEIWIPIRMK